MVVAESTLRFNVADFNLAATLQCGQAFRWELVGDGWWCGVVGHEHWRVRQDSNVLTVCGPRGGDAVARVQRYFALDRSLPQIVATFPDDPPLREAVRRHWGLRVLRQPPWETLASFIASSTKQIVQIQQIVGELARRWGEPVGDGQFAFPTASVLARVRESELRGCRLGFRARYLLAAARAVDSGQVPVEELSRWEYEPARAALLSLPGVGEKIAACVLLFGCGFDAAFPVDVWVERALRRIYFPSDRVSGRVLRAFAARHFGPYAGWAQQYLFFQERLRGRQSVGDRGEEG